MSEITPERLSTLAPKTQQKILAARLKAQQKAEEAEQRRAQRKLDAAQLKEEAEALSEWLRYEELRAIPIKDRSRDENAEFQRLYRHQRKQEEESPTEVVTGAKTREHFWQMHRTALSPSKLKEYRERHEKVLDDVAWLDRVAEGRETVENCGENFVSIDEGRADLLADIKVHGVTRLGYLYANPEIPSDWGSGDRTGLSFWKSPETFRMMCNEGQNNATYTKYGFCVAVPDWMVARFLKETCDWLPEHIRTVLGQTVDARGRTIYPE